jgi:DNA-directed RNA polymerase subunit RPC12/RpoP
MAVLNGNTMFPCPVCSDPREVRQTKKRKPYITCDPCGIQVFVRGPAGISAFNRLVEGVGSKDVWTRLREMERRYRLKCPQCGCRFWIEPSRSRQVCLTELFRDSAVLRRSVARSSHGRTNNENHICRNILDCGCCAHSRDSDQ